MKKSLLFLSFFGFSIGLAAAPGDDPRAKGASRPPGMPAGWSRELGGAVIVNPSFRGSTSYNVLPVPYFDFRYRDAQGVKYFVNVPQGLGAYVVRRRDDKGTRQAISVALAPGFANRDAEDIDGLETFGPSLEARVGWEYSVRSWALGASVSQALGTGHEGLYAELNVSRRQRIGQRGFLAFGPRLRFGDDQYMNAFYGVTNRESIRSGLNAYEAQAGLDSVGFQAVLSLPAFGRWRWSTVAQVSVLASEASDSSLVEQDAQGFFLTALTRQF